MNAILAIPDSVCCELDIVRQVPDTLYWYNQMVKANPDWRIELLANARLWARFREGTGSCEAEDEIVRQLLAWSIATDKGYVMHGKSAGFHCPDGSIRIPDASLFFDSKSSRQVLQDSLLDLATPVPYVPVFTIDVLSEKGDMATYLDRTYHLLTQGVAETWLVDLKEEIAHIYKPGFSEVVEKCDQIDASNGFSLDCSAIWQR